MRSAGTLTATAAAATIVALASLQSSVDALPAYGVHRARATGPVGDDAAAARPPATSVHRGRHGFIGIPPSLVGHPAVQAEIERVAHQWLRIWRATYEMLVSFVEFELNGTFTRIPHDTPTDSDESSPKDPTSGTSESASNENTSNENPNNESSSNESSSNESTSNESTSNESANSSEEDSEEHKSDVVALKTLRASRRVVLPQVGGLVFGSHQGGSDEVPMDEATSQSSVTSSG